MHASVEERINLNSPMADTEAGADQWHRSAALALLFKPAHLNLKLWPQHFSRFTRLGVYWDSAQQKTNRRVFKA